jgi:predicted amidohydrolase YtcJ
VGSPSPTAIYTAAAVHTLDPSRPTAEAVAVRDGRFLAVGTVDDLLRIDGATVDGSLERSVLLPGFVEAHSHTMAGGMWLHTYCGRFDRRGPDGHVWPGCTDLAAVIQRLREAEADLSAAGAGPDEPLLAWGLDPIYYPGERLVARHLDLVSTTRPIFVMHASCHLATVNTALMELDGIGPDTDMEGLPKDGSGWPIGELQEPAAMVLADSAFRKFWGRMRAEESLWNFGGKARNTGTTTLTDLGNRSSTDPAEIERFRKAVDHDDFPARLSVFHMPTPGTPEALEEAAAAVVATRAESSDKLRFGHVKLVVDGSIQGFTARLRWPGYLQEGNGIWVVPPEQVADILRPYHRAGLLIHVHCNGDEAVDVYLEAVEDLLTEHPRFDHRHTVQHCQLTSPGQYRRMAGLGMCANVFANHTWFWGDQHASETVGPDRAARMNSARTALDLGVPLSMHSDAPVTPLGGLHVAWCAVNRLTPSGTVLGPEERISVAEALHAITMGAAHQLEMEDEVGSISPRKHADLAILEADPFAIDPVELRDIPVRGTMLGGRILEAD